MPKLTVSGHPLHPILSDGWVLFPFSLAMDVLARGTGRASYADAAYYSMTGGYAVGLAAAAAGLADYLTIRSGTSTKRTANAHALLNAAAIAAYTVNLALRRSSPSRVDALPFALSVVGTSLLGLSASYGGDLVYRHGMRVDGVSPVAGAPEVKLLPGDDRVHEALERATHLMPAAGPELDAAPRGAARGAEPDDETP